jgi:hypothetical protein
MKFKTVEQVFVHNFEALQQWRKELFVPGRLPEAVRYFIATQLVDPGAIFVDKPRFQDSKRLVFSDASVLVLPDNLSVDMEGFEWDEETRDLCAEIQRNIRLLTREHQARKLIQRALEIVDSIDRIYPYGKEEVQTVGYLEWALRQKLMEVFSLDQCRVRFLRCLPQILKRAERLLVRLPQIRAVFAAWLARQMGHRSGRRGRSNR